MTCGKARRLTSLLAGSDITGPKATRLKSHLISCPGCRQDFKDIRTALEEVKALAREETPPDWGETEWKETLARVVSPVAPRKSPAPSPSPRLPVPAWAYPAALLAAAAIIIGILVVKNQSARSVLVSGIKKERAVIAKIEPPPVGLKRDKAAAGRDQVEWKPAANSRSRFQPAEAARKTALAGKTGSEETMTMAWVSEDSGLTVYWVFNTNFEWKEDEK